MRQALAQIAVCLDPTATRAAQHVRTALALEGCGAVDISPAELPRRVPEVGNCLILVYDASPSEENVSPTIRELWLRFPDLPLLLYVPPLPYIGRVLTATRDVPTVVIELQTQALSEPERLRARIRELLGRTANTNFRRILGDVLSKMPDSLRLLIEQQVHSLEVGRPGQPSVGLLASQTGLTLRRIEQVSRSANLPAPRDLLDSVTLLWIAFGARRRGISTARFAKEVGISTERLYRMRRRLIQPSSRNVLRDPSAELATLFHRLARWVQGPSKMPDLPPVPAHQFAGLQ